MQDECGCLLLFLLAAVELDVFIAGLLLATHFEELRSCVKVEVAVLGSCPC